MLGPPTYPLSQSHPRPNQSTRDYSLHVLTQLGGCCFPNMCGVRRAANWFPILAVSLPHLRDQRHSSWHPPSTSSPRSRPQIRRWPRTQDRSLSCHTTCCVRTSLLIIGLVMRYFKVPHEEDSRACHRFQTMCSACPAQVSTQLSRMSQITLHCPCAALASAILQKISRDCGGDADERMGQSAPTERSQVVHR